MDQSANDNLEASVISTTSTDVLFGPGISMESLSIELQSVPPLPTKEQSLKYINRCMELSKQAPPRRLYLRSGCVIVSQSSDGQQQVEAEGYTHKQIDDVEDAFDHYLTHHCQHNPHDSPEESIADNLPPNIIIYTSVEPCVARSNRGTACVDRIIQVFHAGADIRKVIFGAWDPGKGEAHKILEDAGIDWEYIPDHAIAIRKVARNLRKDMDIGTWLADRAWLSSGAEVIDVRKVRKDAEKADNVVWIRKKLIREEMDNPKGIKPGRFTNFRSKWPEYKSAFPAPPLFDPRTRMLI